MRNRRDFDLAVAAVGRAIRSWDPYRLLQDGAPDDEFEGETLRIVARVPNIRSSADAAQAISDVFSASFGSDGFSREDCAEPGKNLFDQLAAAGLIGQ